MYNSDVGSVSRLVLLVVRSKLTLVITGGNINLLYFVESVFNCFATQFERQVMVWFEMQSSCVDASWFKSSFLTTGVKFGITQNPLSFLVVFMSSVDQPSNSANVNAGWKQRVRGVFGFEIKRCDYNMLTLKATFIAMTRSIATLLLVNKR